MAIPLWRQYSRLSREDRDSILERRRARLSDASSREEILAAFRADGRDVENRYRNRTPGASAAEAAAEGAANVDNSPFARQQRAFEGLNDRDSRLARNIANRTSIPVEDIPGELASYRNQVASRVSGRTPGEIDAIVADSLARSFPKR